MGLLDRVLGRPHDPQEERTKAREGEGAGPSVAPADDVAAAETAEEPDVAAKVRRDEEAARHQGI
jgi:hypothetical protein